MTIYRSLREIAYPGECCVALGMFDGLHLGHQSVVNAAVTAARGRRQPAAVFTFSLQDIRPVSKGGAPFLLSSGQRDRLLADMGVDLVVCPPFEEFRDLSPEKFVADILVETLGARCLFCGENYHFGKRAAGDADALRDLGARFGIGVHVSPMLVLDGLPVSSTRLRELIAGGEMDVATGLLGRLFAIDFEVIHGRQLGRTLGSPTINQPLPDGFVVPRFGVYATITTVGSSRHISVTNVGVKPTVGSDRPLAETYIHGFDGDLYGKSVLVEFLRFMRPERRFPSVEELRAQIQRDNLAAAEIGKSYL